MNSIKATGPKPDGLLQELSDRDPNVLAELVSKWFGGISGESLNRLFERAVAKSDAYDSVLKWFDKRLFAINRADELELRQIIDDFLAWTAARAMPVKAE